MSSQKIHLLHLLKEPNPAQRHLEITEVPDGVSQVVAGTGQGIRFSDGQPRCGEQALVVEPVESRNQMTLLVLGRLRGNAVKINGLPAPPVAFAAVGDQLTFGDGLAFRVLLHQSPSIGSPSGAQVGKECLVCRLPVVEDTHVYTCLNGCTIHCESEDHKSGAEPLECARLVTECPACQTPVNLEKGYTHVPEL